MNIRIYKYEPPPGVCTARSKRLCCPESNPPYKGGNPTSRFVFRCHGDTRSSGSCTYVVSLCIIEKFDNCRVKTESVVYQVNATDAIKDESLKAQTVIINDTDNKLTKYFFIFLTKALDIFLLYLFCYKCSFPNI